MIPTKRHLYPELAAAGLWTTPSDLTRFLISVSKARQGQPSPVESTVARQMTTPIDLFKDGDMSIGLGPFLRTLNGHPMFGHGGSNRGFRCEMLASFDAGFGYAVMTNSGNGDQLIQAIYRTLFSQPGWPGGYEVLERVKLPDTAIAAISGFCSTGGIDVFQIKKDRGSLLMYRPFEGSSELVHLGEGKFVDRQSRTFVQLDKGGKALTLDLAGEARQRAERLSPIVGAPLWELERGREKQAISAWKLLSDRSDEAQLASYEGQLNRLGYQLAERQELDAALKVLGFVTRVRPESSNAFDSLAEIQALRGENESAISNYEKSIRLLKADPQADKAIVTAHESRVHGLIEQLRKP